MQSVANLAGVQQSITQQPSTPFWVIFVEASMPCEMNDVVLSAPDQITYLTDGDDALDMRLDPHLDDTFEVIAKLANQIDNVMGLTDCPGELMGTILIPEAGIELRIT